ncbi:MAG: hypothetical protein ABIN01_20235 [Ferruginibacter sp.]
MHFKNYYPLVALLLIAYFSFAQKNTFPIVTSSAKVSIIYDNKSAKLDSIAANLLAEDIERVTYFEPEVMKDIAKAKGDVIVSGNIQSAHKPSRNISKAFVISGSDARGTAYGVFTRSEKIGVSPWYWWADVPAKQQKDLTITQNDFVSLPPTGSWKTGQFVSLTVMLTSGTINKNQPEALHEGPGNIDECKLYNI